MNFLRNTFAVLVGLAVAGILISLGVRLNSSWITYQEYAPFKHWKSLLQSMEHKPYFFVALLISSGIGATVGGVVTAILVKYAKVAYAILIGFILLFIAMLDIIIFPSVSYTHLDVYKRQRLFLHQIQISEFVLKISAISVFRDSMHSSPIL